MVCTDCENTRILYHGIKNAIPVSTIITEEPVSKSILIKRRIKKLGLIVVAGQLLFQGGIVPFLRKIVSGKVKAIIQDKGLDVSPLPAEKIIKVTSVNNAAFIEAIKAAHADLIIVNGTRIISAATLQQVNCPIINIHVGITPLYRGVHGAYWALAKNDKKNCGVTVHAIDKGIDTGGILAQATIETSNADNFITYPYLQFEKAIELVKDVVPAILSGSSTFLQAPPGVSKLWYHPTIWQYLRNRFKGIK